MRVYVIHDDYIDVTPVEWCRELRYKEFESVEAAREWIAAFEDSDWINIIAGPLVEVEEEKP